MSTDDSILLFLDNHNELEDWLHLRSGRIVARGHALDGLPSLADTETGDPIRLVAVVPGDAVAVHWLELPAGLAPAQAIAAARLLAADVSAQPVADMHVGVGLEAVGQAARAVALVPAITMAGWIGRLQSAGFDPDLVLPEPLLLVPPDKGFVRYEGRSLPLFRSQSDAFSIEPELAEIILPRVNLVTLGAEEFEAGIASAIAAAPVNLRQGAFAKRRAWKLEWKLIRRLALLALGILFVTLAIQIVNIARYTYSADALEAEANRHAAQSLKNASVANAPAQLARRVTELGGNGAGYGSLASAVFAAIRDTPNVELTGMIFNQSGSLRATVQADGPASISALQARVEASGFSVVTGPLRNAGGGPVTELTVSPR